MVRIAKVVRSLFEKLGAAPGKAVVVQTEAAGGVERKTEFFHNPGISSAPTPNDRAVLVPIQGGYRVAVGSHNYRIEVEPSTGETVVYSTNASGSAVSAKVHLKADGTIELNGSAKTFVTHAELSTALSTFVTALNTALGTKLDGSGTVGTLTLDISAAETTTVVTGG